MAMETQDIIKRSATNPITPAPRARDYKQEVAKLIDVSSCVGCKACQVACSEWNDIRDWGDRFAKERITLFFGPGRHGPGNNLFFMVVDADRNRLEFSAELELAPADREAGVWPQSEHTLNSWGRAWMRT